MSWSQILEWWSVQPGWARWVLGMGSVVLAVLWAYVAWLYRPEWRPRIDLADLLHALTPNPARAGLAAGGPTWSSPGATVDWSPKASVADAGESGDLSAAAVARAKLVETEVRLDVAARLEAADAREELTIAEAGTAWELASIELDRICAAGVARFAEACGRILEPWQEHVVALQLAAVHPQHRETVTPAPPVWPARPATGKRARRDRKRINQGKAVAA